MALVFGLMSSFITVRSVLKNTIGDSIRKAAGWINDRMNENLNKNQVF